MAKVSQYDGTMVRVGDRIERFDKGSAIPAHADPDHVAMLEERGMVVDGEPHAGLTAVSEATGAFVLPDSTVDDPDGPGGAPAKSAAKADWVDYAVSVQVAGGVAEADARALAENLTKEQLIEQYGAA